MHKYQIELKPSAKKELSKINNQDAQKISIAIDKLVNNPFPVGYKKLKANENKYRIRVGNYRVIYNIDSNIVTILILKIGHRKNVYHT